MTHSTCPPPEGGTTLGRTAALVGVAALSSLFLAGFPYLNTPIPGTGARAEPTAPSTAPAAASRGNGSK